MGGHHRGQHAVGTVVLGGQPMKGGFRVSVGAGASGRHRPAPPAGSVLTLADFNADELAATEVLGACLDIPEWVQQVAGGRPYATVTALRAAGRAAAAGISWDQVAGALDRHPRIGEQTSAVSGTHTDSAWSSAEQSGVGAGQADSLARGNRAYEERFGYIFLICAAGLSGEEILASLQERLGHDAAAEQPVVIDELQRIAELRLAKAVVA